MSKTCDICPSRHAVSGHDSNGNVYRACRKHKRYLKVWIGSMNAEYASENAAAARYEGEYE